MYKLIVYNSLPPVPDSKKNNETLLGIDSNNNGIRDDVEIKILTYKPWYCKKWKNKPECNLSSNPAFIAVSFQYARAFQTILREFDGSKDKAYEIEKITSKAVECSFYFNYIKKIFYENTGSIVEKYTFNNEKRTKIF